MNAITRQMVRSAGQFSLIFAFFFLCPPMRGQETTRTNNGLAVVFTSDDGRLSDAAVLPNAWLYVPRGQSPTPFLPPGKFNAAWTGLLDLELRSDYSFQADLLGDLKIEVNGATVLETSGKGETTVSSKPIRLNKGANAITLRLTSTAEGEAQLRLYWAPKGAGALFSPLPNAALTYQTTPELTKSLQARRGRELFIEFRCLKCHEAGLGAPSVPELQMDAPNFQDIGSRRNTSWLASWIENPKEHRAAARMPQMFHEPDAKTNAQAIAAFLTSGSPSSTLKEEKFGANDAEAGKKLFENLHCVACHQPPDAADMAETKIPLREVPRKFAPGALSEFLLKPAGHYEWIRMPNFKLTREEATQLAAFLTSASTGANTPGEPAAGTAQIEWGRKLVLTSGCLNCHPSSLKNEFKAKSLADLNLTASKQGCLAANVDSAGKAPFYNFSDAQRADLAAFGAADKASLTRNVPAEFAQRQAQVLNCVECHGKFEGFPLFDNLGDKLQPEWSRSFIGGEISYKPRPWLVARMPSFGTYAGGLAEGLAALHGYPAQTPVEPPIDQEAAKVGQKLISAIGGFSCISCHSVGEFGATQVFESAGINFAYSGRRLIKPYFHRWVRNPLAIDPTTKMPVYFDEEGKSPLADIYDGDGTKQREAIWQYLRLGDKMPPPPTQ